VGGIKKRITNLDHPYPYPRSDAMKTIDATPSREAYLIMLKMIADYSSNADDRKWARLEIAKMEAES
jgi:hypothetical protein